MIASLTGQITEKLTDGVILEAGGVGYEVFMTLEDVGRSRLGSETKLYIYDHVREDVRSLYGFQTLSSKQLFVQLIAISGVGPKLGMQILSAGESRLRQAIAAGNPELLRGVSGVGTKTAQRVIVELKDKVGATDSGLAPVTDEAYQALVSLGYTPAEATQAVAKLPDSMTDPKERVQQALRQIKK